MRVVGPAPVRGVRVGGSRFDDVLVLAVAAGLAVGAVADDVEIHVLDARDHQDELVAPGVLELVGVVDVGPLPGGTAGVDQEDVDRAAGLGLSLVGDQAGHVRDQRGGAGLGGALLGPADVLDQARRDDGGEHAEDDDHHDDLDDGEAAGTGPARLTGSHFKLSWNWSRGSMMDSTMKPTTDARTT